MADVQIRGVVKNFSGAAVLKGIDIDVKDGEFLSLVGPSGCGKSTLLRLIAGLEEISGGEIDINGTVVNRLAAKDRDIAMVFQNYALYPHMTVRENMSFSLEMRERDKSEIARSVATAAGILGLDDLLERYPRQLSGGQQQRVAMGRAIVRNPQVFLFDEPLSNLDAKLRVQMRAEIRDLHSRLKATTIYVTHDQLEAMTMADRIVVMRGGAIEQIGSPLELYDKPANAFVATFIGSPAMNLIECTVGEQDGERVCLTLREQPFTRLPEGIDLPKGAPVYVGVRPEDLQVGDAGPEAEVVVVEATGPETQITVNLDDRHVTLVVKGRSRLLRGERIRLAHDPDKQHFFDTDTGARI